MRAVSALLYEDNTGGRHERAVDALAKDLSNAGALDRLYTTIRNAIYSSPTSRSEVCDRIDREIDDAFATLRRYRAIVAQIREL